MIRTALTLVALIALSGCAKPGCGYSGALDSARERAHLNQFEAERHEDEYRAACGMRPRRSMYRNTPGMVCVGLNGRTICRMR